jgi:hypothetical protein
MMIAANAEATRPGSGGHGSSACANAWPAADAVIRRTPEYPHVDS